MARELDQAKISRNIKVYPYFGFFRNLMFVQAVWFLFFQHHLSAAEAILLYVVYDIGATALEVPSGYMSDLLGRRITLVLSALSGLTGTLCLAFGNSFEIFVVAQILMGAATAFASGTDSALLYESLSAVGRQKEVEREELKAWRFSFSALAISAVLGGFMTMLSFELPFFVTAVSFIGVLTLAFTFTEPPKSDISFSQGGEIRNRPARATCS
jgi:MFS family permease